MDRRHFIEITVAGAVGVGLPGAAWWAARFPERRILAEPALLALLGGPRVRAIGRRYREAYPEENDAEILSAAILNDAGPDLPPATALHTRLHRQVQADFEAGRTVLLKGWVLSLTEARQCALFSLMPA